MPTAFPPALARAIAPWAPPQSEVHAAARRESWANWPAHPAELTASPAPKAAESNEAIRRSTRVLERVGRAGA